jgi:GntR family transcriptional regulator, transcriptional repressor for pyruvate dehydrogenase complex
MVKVPMDWSTLKRGRALSVPDRLSVDLERLILDGSLKTGDRLPSERELCEMLGVSRVSVRQALHELEARHMIDRRPGRGTVVISSSASTGDAGDAISALLNSVANDTTELARIMELRSVIEAPIAGLAARRVTDRDLEQLRALVDEMDAEKDLTRYAELDRAFHQAIAVYTHNPLLAQLNELIGTQIAPSRRRALQTAARRQTSSVAHRRIFEAIARHDAEAAEAEARAHVENVLQVALRTSAAASDPEPR